MKDPPPGYPNLACFLDSDEDFMIYRRFGFLQARIILHKQDELRSLEQRLDDMDQDDFAVHEKRRFLKSRELDDAKIGKRRTLIEEIAKSFKEYCKLTQYWWRYCRTCLTMMF